MYNPLLPDIPITMAKHNHGHKKSRKEESSTSPSESEEYDISDQQVSDLSYDSESSVSSGSIFVVRVTL